MPSTSATNAGVAQRASLRRSRAISAAPSARSGPLRPLRPPKRSVRVDPDAVKAWAQALQPRLRAMGGTERHELLSPRLDDAPGRGEAHEPVLVEALVAQPPVEALDVRILHRLARVDEVQVHPMGIRPSI